jgi:hypothetical protein
MKLIYTISLIFILFSCATNKNISGEKVVISSTPEEIQTNLEIEFYKEKAHNHPSFAIWIEDLEGNYVETLFVTQFVATGKFDHGEIEPGIWKNEPGEVRRPETLPYWAHKRNIKAEDGLFIPSPKTAVPDAISGATPPGNFSLRTGTKIKNGKFRILMEINQAWDSNKFWSNNKFPDDRDYFRSLQPALVYDVTIDINDNIKQYFLNPIGHSHYSGKDGRLYTDISTLTSAKEIAGKIIVTLK